MKTCHQKSDNILQKEFVPFKMKKRSSFSKLFSRSSSKEGKSERKKSLSERKTSVSSQSDLPEEDAAAPTG